MATFLKAVTDTLDDVLKEPPPDSLPPRPEIIKSVATAPADLTGLAIDTGDWGKFQQWLDRLKSLFATDPKAFVETLLFRALELRLPRVAGALIVLGLVEHDLVAGVLQKHRVMWDRLFSFLTGPQHLLEFWKDKVDRLEDVQLLQIYLPTLVMAPVGFLQMEHKGIGFSNLPSPKPPATFPPELDDLLRDTVRSPTPLPLPPAGLLTKDQFVDLIKAVRKGTRSQLASVEVKATPGATFADSFDLDAILTIPTPPTALTGEVNIGDGWVARVATVAPATTRLELHRTGRNWTANASGGTQGELISFELAKEGSPAISLGDTRTLLLEIARIKLVAAVRAPDPSSPGKRLFSIGLHLDGLMVTANAPGLDLLGFTGSGGLKASADLRAEYVQGEGLRAQGGGDGQAALGLDMVTPVNKTVGGGAAGLTLGSVHSRVEVAPDSPGGGAATGLLARLKLTFDVRGTFGPVEVVADGLGAWFGRWRDGPGAPLQAAGLIPPTGVGLTINAGPISGGGFLSIQKFPNDGIRFGGGLSLKLSMIGIGALGLLERTAQGKSFLAVLGIRFNPGIQLGFGIELTGVGGLVGIDRRADIDVLRERLASGAAGNVLFCDDPVRNGPALLGDLAAFFPFSPGSFLVGPTLQLSWIAPIIRLDIGVLIELPGPRKILLVGSARATIGTEDAALVRLRLDFVGGLDLVKQELTFDASLVNSTVLGFLTLTGDAAFRLCYGDRPDIVLSIGGFHPSFNPESLHLRPLARAAATYSINVGVKIWLRQEAYFAFTSNTLQVGGRTEAGLEIGPFGAHGFMALDALVQFKPFHFTVGFSAGFDIDFEGVSFAGVNIAGQISGPGPLVITASASVKLLFIRVSHSETFQLGSDQPDPVVTIPSVLNAVLDEVKNAANLHASGDDPLVRLKSDPPADGRALFCPLGRLTWSERLLPLETTITRLGGRPLTGAHRIDIAIDGAPPGVAEETVREWFSPGQFGDLSQSDQLNNPAMQSLPSGHGYGGNVETALGDLAADPEKVNVIKLPKEVRLFFLADGKNALFLSAAHAATMQDRLATPTVSGGPPRVAVKDETWSVRDSSGVVRMSTSSGFEAFQQTRFGGFAAVPGDRVVNVSTV